MDRITEFESVLDLLSEQWIRCERPTRKPSARLLVKPMILPFNPAWIAVSRFSRTVLFRLPELCQSVRPLLLIGETGSGRNYLAQLIHRSGPDPFSPFTILEEKASKESGTLFIPDWEHRTAQERKSLLQDERRIIAAMTPGKDVDDIIRAWELSNQQHRANDAGSILEGTAEGHSPAGQSFPRNSGKIHRPDNTWNLSSGLRSSENSSMGRQCQGVSGSDESVHGKPSLQLSPP